MVKIMWNTNPYVPPAIIGLKKVLWRDNIPCNFIFKYVKIINSDLTKWPYREHII